MTAPTIPKNSETKNTINALLSFFIASKKYNNKDGINDANTPENSSDL